MQYKTVRKFTDYGYGFPVILKNIRLRKAFGVWTPDININILEKTVLKSLLIQERRLVGAEVKFIRLYNRMTLAEFAKRFGVSHVSVIKWEAKKNLSTNMAWCIEKDIRLFIQKSLSKSSANFLKLYNKLEHFDINLESSGSNAITILKLAA